MFARPCPAQEPTKWTRGLSVETTDPRLMSEEATQALYAFSNSILKENWVNFFEHLILHDTIYIFRRQEDSTLVGFSCWRHTEKNSGKDRVKIMIQGKLRILSSHRRIGLHVWATLWYWFALQWRSPWQTVWYSAFVSLFNYVSLRRSISHFYVMDRQYEGRPKELLAIQALIDERIAEDRYETVKENPGVVNVKIKVPPETFNEFPPSFCEIPEAKEYIQANPGYADGFDLCVSYPFSLRNVMGLLFRGIQQTYWR